MLPEPPAGTIQDQQLLNTTNPIMAAHPQPPTPLFSPTLISPTLLPPNYTIRPLHASDLTLGFLDVLRVLTTVGDINAAEFNARFEEMRSSNGAYYVVVVLDGEEGVGHVVGTGALVVERKL
jgi:glucosamine-phosphate N-acetyltransferase